MFTQHKSIVGETFYYGPPVGNKDGALIRPNWQ